MPTPIVMPSFGMYTAEGTLVAWLHPDGARVKQGEPVLEIETDKAVNQVPAPADGILHHVVQPGTLLKEEALIGYILAEGEQPPSLAKVSPRPQPAAQTEVAQTAPGPSVVAEKSVDPIIASPIARRLAEQHGIDLTKLKGTGPGGRIGEADVMALVSRTQTGGTPSGATLKPARRIREHVPLVGMRRTIAERLRRTLDQAVSLTLTREVEADKLVAVRQKFSERLGASATFDAFFVKLLAAGLRERPELNSVILGDEILLLDEVNISFAVAVAGGLITPVVHDADQAPLDEICRSIHELAERARAGLITTSDLEGGTATITNLGGQSIDAFTPVLNPPQSCILGIGRIQPRPIVRDGAFAVAQTCVLSLTFDHRVTDGVPAAQLLDAIARRMNDEAYLQSLL